MELLHRHLIKYNIHENKLVNYKKLLFQYITKHTLKRMIHIYDQKPHNQLSEYYSNCLFYVMPASGHENHPLALLEALSYGKAVIISDAGGMPEIITHRKNGLIFRQNDAQHLATTLETLLSNRSLRTSIEVKNSKYRSQFDIHATASRTVTFYSSLETRTTELTHN